MSIQILFITNINRIVYIRRFRISLIFNTYYDLHPVGTKYLSQLSQIDLHNKAEEHFQHCYISFGSLFHNRALVYTTVVTRANYLYRLMKRIRPDTVMVSRDRCSLSTAYACPRFDVRDYPNGRILLVHLNRLYHYPEIIY